MSILKKFIKELWQGDTDLDFVYSKLFFLPSILLIGYLKYFRDVKFNEHMSEPLYLLLLITLLTLCLYMTLIVICVWRSAVRYEIDALSNTNKRAVWGTLAKAHMIMTIFALVMILLSSFGIINFDNSSN